MSQTFIVKPKSSDVFQKIKNMKIGEVVDIFSGDVDYVHDVPFGFMNEEEFFEERLDENVLVFGMEYVTHRGFEFACETDENAFSVRINTPATREDWDAALRFISALTERTDSNIYHESGDEYDSESVWGFSYEDDILCGIDLLYKNLQGSSDTLCLYGSNVDVTVNNEIIRNIKAAADPIEAFSQFMNAIYWEDHFFPSQQFMLDDEGRLIGQYMIFENVRSVIPLEPQTMFKNLPVENAYGKVCKWEVLVCLTDEEKEIYSIGYKDFIEGFKENRKLDANQVIIEAMDESELVGLIEKILRRENRIH